MYIQINFIFLYTFTRRCIKNFQNLLEKIKKLIRNKIIINIVFPSNKTFKDVFNE